jgi:hypothetical protein
MTKDQMELLSRVFAMNEQIVMALTNPIITKTTGWQDLKDSEVKTIVANSQTTEWAVLMAQSTLKEKNNG